MLNVRTLSTQSRMLFKKYFLEEINWKISEISAGNLKISPNIHKKNVNLKLYLKCFTRAWGEFLDQILDQIYNLPRNRLQSSFHLQKAKKR